MLAPADRGWFCITLGCLAADPVMRALRSEAAFDAAVSAVEPLRPWVHPERVAVEPGVRVMRDTPNRLVRTVVHDSPVALGIVTLGDSTMVTNPGYGRGVGLALVHAQLLAEALDEHPDDLLALARAFDEVTRAELEPWYHAAVAGDRVRRTVGRRVLAGEALNVIGGPDDDPAVRFSRALPHAVETDPVVRRVFHRTFQLLDPPQALEAEDIRARVDAVRCELDGSVPPPPGPDHDAMARLLSTAGDRAR